MMWKETHPIRLHDGGVSTTTEVWDMLSASFDGDVGRVFSLQSLCLCASVVKLT
jgi:hypothetical protein